MILTLSDSERLEGSGPLWETSLDSPSLSDESVGPVHPAPGLAVRRRALLAVLLMRQLGSCC